jgi:glycerophosphoryl diester phosphodiesterase
LQVAPWTVDSEANWDRMIDARVDAIITDDPAALLAHLKSKGFR